MCTKNVKQCSHLKSMVIYIYKIFTCSLFNGVFSQINSVSIFLLSFQCYDIEVQSYIISEIYIFVLLITGMNIMISEYKNTFFSSCTILNESIHFAVDPKNIHTAMKPTLTVIAVFICTSALLLTAYKKWHLQIHLFWKDRFGKIEDGKVQR
jgi:hypothetical protein